MTVAEDTVVLCPRDQFTDTGQDLLVGDQYLAPAGGVRDDSVLAGVWGKLGDLVIGEAIEQAVGLDADVCRDMRRESFD